MAPKLPGPDMSPESGAGGWSTTADCQTVMHYWVAASWGYLHSGLTRLFLSIRSGTVKGWVMIRSWKEDIFFREQSSKTPLELSRNKDAEL